MTWVPVGDKELKPGDFVRELSNGKYLYGKVIGGFGMLPKNVGNKVLIDVATTLEGVKKGKGKSSFFRRYKDLEVLE